MKVPLDWQTTFTFILFLANAVAKPSAFVDTTINIYITERLCWSKESCKEEFQTMFTCRCPEWSYCRSPGRYYNAYCSIVRSGYIWAQDFNNTTTPK